MFNKKYKVQSNVYSLVIFGGEGEMHIDIAMFIYEQPLPEGYTIWIPCANITYSKANFKKII